MAVAEGTSVLSYEGRRTERGGDGKAREARGEIVIRGRDLSIKQSFLYFIHPRTIKRRS